MLTVFFIIAIIGLCVVVVHITVELNTVEKKITLLLGSLKKRYETNSGAGSGQSTSS